MWKILTLSVFAFLGACAEAPSDHVKGNSDADQIDASQSTLDGSTQVREYSGCYTDFNCETGKVCMNFLCLSVADEPNSSGTECLKVNDGCRIYATHGDDSVVSASWYVYKKIYCWPPDVAVMLNVVSSKWALSSQGKDNLGNWCSDEEPNEVIDVSCFVNQTPEELGFKVHCTHDDNGYPRTLVWVRPAEP